VINKTSNSASGINIYIDDMTNAQSTTTGNDGAFDNTNYSNSVNQGFYARNNDGAVDNHIATDAGAFEFNTVPYSQSEREDFVSRRPEV